MLKYFIQVTETSVSAFLIIAGILALVWKNGTGMQKAWAGFGAAFGVVSALVLAILRRETRWVNREMINIFVLPCLIIAGVIFILLALGVLSKSAPRLHARLLAIVGAVFGALLLFYELPDIFLYISEFRGAEESIFSTDALFKALGWSGGLLLAAISSLALFRAGVSLRRPLPGIFIAIGAFIQIVDLATAFLQFLMARRIVPVTDWMFDLLLPAINHQEYFIYALLLVMLFIPAILWVVNARPGMTGQNPAQNRKIRAEARRLRRWSALALTGFIAVVACLTVLQAYNEREVTLSPAESMEIAGGEIRVPIAQVEDGHLHRFAYSASDGTEVRFIVVKKSASAFGVGLDACDICGATGYYERENEVICKLCDVVMNKSTIGFKGGCNPVPLDFAIRDGVMIVQTESLEQEKNRFQ